jgi:outer membrane autotransporter protein
VIFGANAGIELYGGGFSPADPNIVTVGANATVVGANWAIQATPAYNEVKNYGTVAGNVDLGPISAFINEPGGVFDTGPTVIASVENGGTLAPGGIGTVQTTALTGSVFQTASGRFAVDVNLANATADRLNVTGTATLAGSVVPQVTNIFGPTPQTFTILSAAGGTTNSGLTVQDSAVVNYELNYPNASDVQLTVAGINFAPSGLTANEKAVGQDLQQAYTAGGGGLSSLLTSLANLDFASFATRLDRLTPEPYLAQAQSSLWSGLDFSNSLFSCPVPSTGGHGVLGEGSCFWVLPSGHVAAVGSHDGSIGFTESAAGLAAGMQGAIAPNWYLDAGFGYQRSDIDTDSSSARGNVFHGGAALKYIHDHWLIAGSVSGSVARYDTSRFDIPTAGTATANADTTTLDARLRFAYAFGTSAFYVKPLVDFDAIGLWRGAINENGAGALNLQVQSETEWLASVAPAVEFGSEWRHGDAVWRPFVHAGVRLLSRDVLSATASFAGAPAGYHRSP